ncbi:MAG: class D sortase [Candidatus Saccharimonadales bacterium]
MATNTPHTGKDDTNQPAHKKLLSDKERQSAADLVRSKIDAIYKTQKTMTSELEESGKQETPESKHQQFMRELSTSGKSLAEIQTDWHNYYVGLPDNEKHEVWQEFYATNKRTEAAPRTSEPTRKETTPALAQTFKAAGPRTSKSGVVVSQITNPEPPRLRDNRRPMAIKKRIVKQVKTDAPKPPKSLKTKRRQKFESLMVGLAAGGAALIIFLFGFFNEYIFAPFMQPGRKVSATPVILSNDGVAPNNNPEVIIPKIGVQIPVDYTLNTVDEATIQNSLNNGVTHYANTVKPGEIGNTAIFGHSSNNIFNKGQYKFAFVLLHKLTIGDTFYLTNNGKAYTYRIFQTKVVDPTETWVLGPVDGKTATAALITCDPPGTTAHRLVVWGEQISPDPNSASQPASAPAVQHASAPTQIAGKGPGAWTRFMGWINPFD